jgi:hypothetical protein
MKTKDINIGNTTEKIVFLISSICIVSIIALDKLYWGSSIFKEEWPNFSVYYIIRSVLIFISTIGLCWSLIGNRKPTLVISESYGISFELVSIIMVLFISVIILFLFIFEPSTFNAISTEDNLIEWASAILLFGSCIITALSFFNSNHELKNSKTVRLSIGLLSFAFFIMAMEEVSWFQRVMDIETPKLFEGNLQNEMNLHNYVTNLFENLYYFGAFVFLVVLPFIRFLFPSISNNNCLKIFVARPFIGIIGSISFAYNFDMWNIIFTQITFFGSLVILCAFAVFSSRRNERYIILFTIVLITTSQILFLVNGINFERLWQITEYKEFFIPLALFVYSWDVFIRIKPAFLLEKTR